MKFHSPEHKLLCYLAKWELMKNDPRWLENPHVQRVLTGGVPDPEKVRELFVEREICTSKEFDKSLEVLRGKGYFSGKEFKAKPEAISEYTRIRDEQLADITAIAEEISKRPVEERKTLANELSSLDHKEY